MPRKPQNAPKRPRGKPDPKGPPRKRGGQAEKVVVGEIRDASLTAETRRRYLNYALSVITSRALPDVRDGLKPVQRRILFTMHNDLRLGADAKPRKSAAVVGDVMGKYHPHGDSAIYDAMVRMAQSWVMRESLVYGQGNFGSIDGDAPAAMRYTEARLEPLAAELLSELGKRTVGWRPNYDGTRSEPVVLPSRFPNLLVNGSQGIAVGMATSIPPHNLAEVIDACVAMIKQKSPRKTTFDELTTFRLLTHVKGPDFPTGGQLLASKADLAAIYESGHGSLKLRGEWHAEPADSKRAAPAIIIDSIPYAVERSTIVEKIAEVILSKKLQALVDVRDESTEDVRVVLELKKDADPNLVMAYLYKHTPLATNVQVNLTCLVPAEHSDAPTPKRLGLRDALAYFLRFRFETVTKRLEFELGELLRRIHILEGFETVFDALDELIRIIRRSDGREDASQKIIKRFKLSQEQTDAILELRLYRLAKLEILIVQKELAEKRAQAKRLGGLLKSDTKRWDLVHDELADLKKRFGNKRRTKVVGEVDEPEFQAEDFIADEDATVILSEQGWVKRLRSVKDLSATRLREGDRVLAAAIGSTRASVAFFSNRGGCYVCRIHDVPPSTGYGDPVQKLFKLADGERMVAMLGFDPRLLDVPEADEESVLPEPPFGVAVTRGGLGFRFSLRGHRDPSTRAGRKYARLGTGDEVIHVAVAHADTSVMCIASDGHALAVDVDELALLSGVGKGSMVMKVAPKAHLVGAQTVRSRGGSVVAETTRGKPMKITVDRVRGHRAARGDVLVKRDDFALVVVEPPALPTLEEA